MPRPGGNAGGQTLFKALGHPLAAERAPELVLRLKAAGPLAVYDPDGAFEAFAAFHAPTGLEIAGLYVQNAGEVGRDRMGFTLEPVSAIAKHAHVFIAAFDAGRHLDQIRPLLHPKATVLSLDALRLPDDMISNPGRYLDPVNFATNFAFLRDAAGVHTRIATANYWGGYGAKEAALWCRLFDASGHVLATWRDPLPAANAGVVIDSRAARARFGLGDFTGSLFIHAVKIKGHDVVKYAIDVYGDTAADLTCTHDANAWPADLYAGLPAPDGGEKVVLWIQNSHPVAIPPCAVGLNLMGRDEVRPVAAGLAPFATAAIDVGALFPEAKWPAQLEIRAGRHFVRPRYEILAADGRRRMAHANVERIDLVTDPELPRLGPLFGKGYVLPLPVPPMGEYRASILPTPMTTAQKELPIKALIYDSSGKLLAEEFLGRIARKDSLLIDLEPWARAFAGDYGHVELAYDFRAGGEGDGWLHAIARIERRKGGHVAETSFGAHIYNTALVYKDEPQSYTNRPPGLTTRLYLRCDPEGRDTVCHLIYPVSLAWRARSHTQLNLIGAQGETVASREVEIPASGSYRFRVHATFTEAERKSAGPGAWVQIRDTTCRLFGFHGLLQDDAFSLDHMFGF
ncbi:MAG: hypothetical protein FJX47_00740 [Alphaproteobacteria bacterium]|nr:hypothetical protein [Alphaproteobacteria bacterium]